MTKCVPTPAPAVRCCGLPSGCIDAAADVVAGVGSGAGAGGGEPSAPRIAAAMATTGCAAFVVAAGVHKAVAGTQHAECPWPAGSARSEEHTSELQSRENLVCRL